ncbi:peptidase domain-containing ABC transporter [Anaerosacchariphilus polymeriproducens]|uniref:Peptidase domain-containing ABC transporter n=1 Tax=Anaerosacchariphilus polymeriproducens TaxID=1812858 RepID=A0A371AXM9_9FIRM|nr:peptidase domain-containing ABC transporter [Anaerosacchariphilus polymeriproducens]RDU24333.1 peptidase domain-containing ABC transporter [Anaerosacchariphilus polymeriproducens]
MKYSCIKQQDTTDCGAACLATISKQYGLRTPISKIREYAGTDKQGTNVYGIIKAAEQIGFSAKGMKGDKEAFFSDFPLPCIAHVVIDSNLFHYIVIHKITRKKIIIADPAEGLITLKPEQFFGINVKESENSKYRWTGVIIFMTPTMKFKTGDKTKGLFKSFLSLLIPHKKILIHIFIASLIYTFLGILGAFYFQALIDYILPNNLSETLMVLSIGIIILSIFKVLLSAFRSHLLLYLSQKIDIALLFGYYKHVINLPMNFFGTRKVGEIISRFQDAGKVRDAISGAVLTLMIDTIMAIIGGIILFRQNSAMFFVTIIMLGLYLLIVWSFNKSYHRLNRNQMENNAKLTAFLVESLHGIQMIKTYNAERNANLKTEIKFVKLLKSVFKLYCIENLQDALKTIVEVIGGIIILWVGSFNVIHGNITIGQLVVFNSLLIYFLEPVKNLINLQPKMQTAIVAANRLGEILDLEIEKTKIEEKKIRPKNLLGDIEFKNVNFRYGTRKLVLENINLKIKCGQKVAFVGESGSGKSTLFKLLLYLYKTESGDILLNDNKIDDIQIEILRDKIAYISQETFLFSGSILENLSFGMVNTSIEDAIEASKLAHAHDFINELPLRYNTNLEENGANISGGQRQRLSIARAMLKKPDILILDEATSNLDAITERMIDETIHKLCINTTVIFIAHRLSTIKKCDKIFVMDKGKIIEEGSHIELIKLSGEYAELVKQQTLESGEE